MFHNHIAQLAILLFHTLIAYMKTLNKSTLILKKKIVDLSRIINSCTLIITYSPWVKSNVILVGSFSISFVVSLRLFYSPDYNLMPFWEFCFIQSFRTWNGIRTSEYGDPRFESRSRFEIFPLNLKWQFYMIARFITLFLLINYYIYFYFFSFIDSASSYLEMDECK